MVVFLLETLGGFEVFLGSWKFLWYVKSNRLELTGFGGYNLWVKEEK